MNFDRFTERIKASAKQAAVAAQNFKGFDEMAAKDEYIQTEGYNAPRKKHTHPRGDEFDETSTLSTHDSLLIRQSVDSLPSILISEAAKPSASSPITPIVPLKVDVPQLKRVVRPPPRYTREDHSPSSALSDVEESSSEEDDQDDPILAMIRRKDSNSVKQREQTTSSSRHRFMEDLEERMALPEQEMPQIVGKEAESTRETTPATLASWFSATTQKLRAPVAKATAPILGSLSRKRYQAPVDELEGVTLVSSKNMLSESELQALAGMRNAPPPSLLSRLARHPRESFIGFTLFAGGFAYFYFSKKVAN